MGVPNYGLLLVIPLCRPRKGIVGERIWAEEFEKVPRLRLRLNDVYASLRKEEPLELYSPANPQSVEQMTTKN